MADEAMKRFDENCAVIRKALTGGPGLPREPTEAMLIAAHDWSYKKYGKPIGNDAAMGCWQAMYDAAVPATKEGFSCQARAGNTGANDPQDCDWPFCGCDPAAIRAVESIEIAVEAEREACANIAEKRVAGCWAAHAQFGTGGNAGLFQQIVDEIRARGNASSPPSSPVKDETTVSTSISISKPEPQNEAESKTSIEREK